MTSNPTAGSLTARILVVLAALAMASLPAFSFAQKKKSEPKTTPTPETAPIVVGPWTGNGDGQALSNANGFQHEGKRPLVVTHSKLKERRILLTGKLTLPAAGAGLRIDFTREQPALVKKGEPVDPNSPTLIAPVSLVLDRNGKTVRCGRGSFDLENAVTTKLPWMLVVTAGEVTFYGEQLVENRPRHAGQFPVEPVLTLSGGASVQDLQVEELPNSQHVPLFQAARQSNTNVGGHGAVVGRFDPNSLPRGLTVVNSVPFYFPTTGSGALDVAASMSGVAEPIRNKSFFFTPGGANLRGRIVLDVPGDQYSALHVVAFSAGRKGHVPRTTVRIGHYGGAAGILEDAVLEVPSQNSASAANDAKPSSQIVGSIPVKLANGKEGTLHHLRLPLPNSNNVKEFKRMDLEFTRDMNTHVLPPDPNEFGKIPAGLPSDVVILAATLEPSSIMLSHESTEIGNAFFDTQKAAFKVTLTNRGAKPAQLKAFATFSGPGTGEEIGIERQTKTVEQKLTLKAGASQTVTLDVTPKKRGWFECSIGVEASGQLLQRRDTSFAVLAPDTRKATTDSPFGIWEFWYPHSVLRQDGQVEKLATLINRGGWRWTYGGSPASRGDASDDVIARMRDQYKIRWNLKSLTDGYQRGEGLFDPEKFKTQMPGEVAHALPLYDPHFKVMHESRSSLDLLRRYSEFLGGKEYNMPAEERQKLEKQFENVKQYCLALKKIDPRVRVALFNDYPSVVFQFLRRDFPKEAFDVIGLEGAMFLRQPERQPDWLSLLGHMHEMKRALKQFGYDKPVWTTEALYHPTEAGALSLHQQSVISVREAMMALQLGVSRMAAAGILKDPSDDYHWSNWGSAGYCFRDPEINPKPAYAMYAWLTQVLDQAKPVGKLATPNTSLHAVDFQRANGEHVYSLWTAKGTQRVALTTDGRAAIYDAFGNPIVTKGTEPTLDVSPTPIYVVSATPIAIAAATPVETKGEIGQMLVDFAKPTELRQLKTTNNILESNWDTPRIQGSFETTFGETDGATTMRVALRPDTDERKLLPRYVEYELAKPITLAPPAAGSAGRPYEFTARVKGNGGWGRILFEVVDAKGRVWTSSGNQYAGASNAADPLGDSFISFTGWHTMRMPIVGMYPGQDQTLYWPRNYNWWPTNSPEEKELAAQAETLAAKYEADLKTFATAQTKYAADLKLWEQAKAEAEKAGKKAPAAPKAPVAPKKQGVRNMGLAAVDYPLKLTKIIVTMRPNILYVDEERPVAEPVIYLDQLGVVAAPGH